MNTPGWIAVAAVVVLLAGGAWWYTQQPATGMPAATDTDAGIDTGAPGSGLSGSVDVSTAPKTVNVSYTDTGFSPSTITIKVGDTVTFVNGTDGRPMWVGADEHPTHTEYDGTTRSDHCAAGYTGPVPFDQCGTGNNYSFLFSKAGTFDYHNHSAAQFEGVVIVQ